MIIGSASPEGSRFLCEIICFSLVPPLDWLDKVYFPAYHTHLASVYTAACAKLAAMGVTVHPSKAGIFLWADFSPVSTERFDKRFVTPNTCIASQKHKHGSSQKHIWFITETC